MEVERYGGIGSTLYYLIYIVELVIPLWEMLDESAELVGFDVVVEEVGHPLEKGLILMAEEIVEDLIG